MTYYVGSQVRVSAEFANSAGTPTDPTAIEFELLSPSGEAEAYAYPPTDADIVKDSTGNYHIDITVAESGTYNYRWSGTGALTAAYEGTFFVEESVFD